MRAVPIFIYEPDGFSPLLLLSASNPHSVSSVSRHMIQSVMRYNSFNLRKALLERVQELGSLAIFAHVENDCLIVIWFKVEF